MDRQLIAVFHRSRGFIDIGEIQAGVNALCVEIQRERHDIDVAGALTISEQRAFDSICPCHHRELSGRDCGAAIVMRMNG
jgi:hypothetical protein